jgi:hypothetical protein
MSSKLEVPLSNYTFTRKPYWLNQYIAGYKGYLELQKLAGYPQDQNILATYQHLLDLRVNSFAKDSPYPPLGSGSENWEMSYHNSLAVARNFMFLTPELADHLNEHIYSEVQDAVDEYEYVAPYWFVAKFDVSYGEGTFQHLYDYPALFQAKAYILQQSYDELVKWLDVPAFYQGDLFYIQNLVGALEAGPAEPTFFLRVRPASLSITTGGEAEYSIQIERRNNFTETVTLQLGDSPSLDLDISPPAPSTFDLAEDQISLTITDNHDPSFSEAVWYTLPLTANGGGITRTAVAYLLMNGKQVFLPAITK